MNRFLRFLFIIVVFAMGGAMILQLCFPEYMGQHSGYGVAVGWQREIGVWNMAVIMIIIAINIRYDWFYLIVVLSALMIGGIGIGTNHLLNYLQYHAVVNGIGALENYLLVCCWGLGWFLEKKELTPKVG